ncbi:MAG: ribosome recycling factor, partial [Synechococcaceae bacterium WB9_3_282]|nr:ribosome recycling factor [Synechococcaceae bacterium WB9_3_282]
QIKKQEKDGELSEDLSRDEQEKVQKVTDKCIVELEKLLADKEADILKV